MTETSTLALNTAGAHSCCLIPRMAQLQYSEMAIVGVSIVTLTWGRGTAMWGHHHHVGGRAIEGCIVQSILTDSAPGV